MKKCKECGRTLDRDEDVFCPACKSRRDHRWKKIVKVAGVVGSMALAIVTRGRFRGGL